MSWPNQREAFGRRQVNSISGVSRAKQCGDLKAGYIKLAQGGAGQDERGVRGEDCAARKITCRVQKYVLVRRVATVVWGCQYQIHARECRLSLNLHYTMLSMHSDEHRFQASSFLLRIACAHLGAIELLLRLLLFKAAAAAATSASEGIDTEGETRPPVQSIATPDRPQIKNLHQIGTKTSSESLQKHEVAVTAR